MLNGGGGTLHVILECGDKDEMLDCELLKLSDATLRSLVFTISRLKVILSSNRKSLNHL